MENEYLLKEKQKLKDQAAILRNLNEQTYQQKHFYELEKIKTSLIDALIHLNTKKLKTSLLSNIIKNHRKYPTCLLAFSHDIIQFSQEFNILTLSHQHYISQSCLLALLLQAEYHSKVKLVAHKDSLKGISLLLSEQQQLDKISFAKDSLVKEGIQILQLENAGTIVDDQQQDIYIIDVFGLNPTQYLPYLFQNFNNLKKASKLFLYHSHYQNIEIRKFLNLIDTYNGSESIINLQICPEHPLNTISLKDQQQMETSILKVAQNEAVNAAKMNIIIFYPLKFGINKFILKLKEMFFKYGLKQSINLIYKKHQKQTNVKNNIFIARDCNELEDWNYDYSDVIFVYDYGQQFYFNFNYKTGCYVEEKGSCSIAQKVKRMSRVAVDKTGIYHHISRHIDDSQHYADSIKDLTIFVTKMIAFGLQKFIDFSNQRISDCVHYMESINIVTKNTNERKLTDERFIQYAKNNISPLETKLFITILDDNSLLAQEKTKYLNLAAMALASIKNQGNLRLFKQQFESNVVRPYAVWRKSGYLESCLQILSKCQLIELRDLPKNSKSKDFRRKTSKVSENKHYIIGSQYGQVPKQKKNFQQMEIQDLIRDYTVDEQSLYQMRDQIQNFRETFNFEITPIILSKQNINRVIRYLLRQNPQTVCYFSGFENRDYHCGNQIISVSQNSLIHAMNQRPEYMIILRTQIDKGKKILLSNSLSEQIYIDLFGRISKRKFSKDAGETVQKENEAATKIVQEQIEISCMSSAVLEDLVQEQSVIEQFEHQNNCHIYLNLELQKATIQCFKDQNQEANNDKIKIVKSNFGLLHKKTEQKCKATTKRLHYMGGVSMVLGGGGAAIQILEKQYFNRCYLTNLPKDCPKEYIQVVLSDHFILKSIQIIEAEVFQLNSSALIEFHSQKDFLKFKQYYQSYLQMENFFVMEEITEQVQKYLKKKNDKGFNDLTENKQFKSYLEFKWFIWKSHGKGQVHFQTKEGAANAIEALTLNPQLDGYKTKVNISSHLNIINIDNLNPLTDQIYLEEALKSYGTIKLVQILKTPLKETAGDHEHIHYLMKNAITFAQFFQSSIGPIHKKNHGLRTCKVKCQYIRAMDEIQLNWNGTIGSFGQGRLHVETWFQQMVLMPEGSLSIYMDLLQETLIQANRPKVYTEILQIDNNSYLSLRSNLRDTLEIISVKFKEKLIGVIIQLPFQAKGIILNQVGIANFLDLQQLYHCKLNASLTTKSLRVLVGKDRIQNIKKQIQERLTNHFFYRVPLAAKHYKTLKNHPQNVKQLQHKFNLILAELQDDSNALLMEGSAVSIQRAINSIYGRYQKSSETKQIGINDCSICSETFESPYRLQCDHKFCKDCLQSFFRFSLGDSKLFPFKCPDANCKQLISIVDLQHIIEYSSWLKIRNLAANEYLKNNNDFIYCYTAGCEQINRLRYIQMNGLKNQHIRCDVCRQAFCSKCYGPYHPARNCKEAKMSEDKLLDDYIKNFGARRCANPKCKVLVEKISGCNKVMCSRCNKCMCFKCPASDMIPYDTPTQCYQHLTEVHGGYF